MAYNKETRMYEGYIYKIYNNINDKVYIGQTIATIEIRWSQHKYDAKNKEQKYPLYHAMNKYGVSNFYICMIEKIENKNKSELRKILNIKECYYIELFNSCNHEYGYNLSVGGQASNTCQKQIDQYDKVGIYIKTWNSLTDVADFYNVSKASVSACCRGKSKSCAGYVWRFHGEDFYLYQNVQNVAVNQFSIDGKLLNGFLSISDASRFICRDEFGVSNITACCKGRTHTSYGYVWRYAGDDFNKYSIDKKESKRFIHKVNCYSLDGKYILTYDSVQNATKKLGLKSASSIQESCSNHNKHARNFLWYYADDPEQPDKSKIIVGY